jgi:hypothetical protein
MDATSGQSESAIDSDDDSVSDHLSITSSALQELMDNEFEDAINMLHMYDISDNFHEVQMKCYKWPQGLSSSVCVSCSKIFADHQNTKALVDGEGFSFIKATHN